MVNSSVSKTLVAAIAILAGSLTGLCTQAIAASGTINIQTVPEGVTFTIVERPALKIVAGGTTPYFDMAFPTGKYTVCFQLDGYQTTWQHSYVQTFGSSWVGPVMKPSNNAAQSTCEEIIARVKAEREEVRASLIEQLSTMELEHVSWSTGNSSDVPASAGGGQGDDHYDSSDAYDNLDTQMRDVRRRQAEDVRAVRREQGKAITLPDNIRR